MDVSQNTDTILIDDKKQSDITEDQIVCIYPEHERNGVTVFFDNYKSLEEICI